MNRSFMQLFTLNRSSHCRLSRAGSLLLPLAVLWLGLLPMAQALLPPPPPDGGYPNFNTAEGNGALFFLTSGSSNTAIGFNALNRNTTGDANTANGTSTLLLNTTGHSNTAIGTGALNRNETGDSNTATGAAALAQNTSGGFNTATGYHALFTNRGSFNTANGTEALQSNTTAFFNTAIGVQALHSNTTGLSNTASGYQALFSNKAGGSNTAIGVQALYRTTGGGNIALGFQAGVNLTTGSNNIAIGNGGVAAESGKIRIGTKGTHNGTFIAGISGVVVTGPQVVVNANGKLGVAASSARFKKAVKPMDETSEAIHQLEPVTFRYKEEIDPNGIPQFGLIAEQVEKVNPDLVVRGEDGKVMTVRYEAVNAMLLNEFLKEHRNVAEQQSTIAELKTSLAKQQDAFECKIAQQQKQIEALTATVQKVSDQVARGKPAPQLVANP